MSPPLGALVPDATRELSQGGAQLAGPTRMPDSPPTAERTATLALWAVPGVGALGFRQLAAGVQGRWGDLLATPTEDWADAFPLKAPVRARLRAVGSLAAVAERVLERLRAGDARAVYPGDAGYPEPLTRVADAPPVLFLRGTVGPPRRRLALVGTRHPDGVFVARAREFARAVAAAGAGVVSGAAAGVDQACHHGALDMGGETWAFVGSALDSLDAAQARLLPAVLDRGGAFYSELPPGVRASPATFPRRNRLISGASDAVVVLRAGRRSGSLYTALAALRQQRPLWALPGELGTEAAEGCNALIWTGKARLCRGPRDALASVGLTGRPVEPVRPDRADLSEPACAAYRVLSRTAKGFEELEGGSGLSAGALLGALCELELLGLVLQTSGGRYEKV